MTSDDEFSVASAKDAAASDELEEWVEEFLSSPGSDNAELARVLSERGGCWAGPLRLPFRVLHRLAGPSGERVLVTLEEDDWADRVDDMTQKVDEEDWEPPPLVVAYRDGQLVLEDGNHRVEGMRRAGCSDHWAVVHFDDHADRDAFTPPDPAIESWAFARSTPCNSKFRARDLRT